MASGTERDAQEDGKTNHSSGTRNVTKSTVEFEIPYLPWKYHICARLGVISSVDTCNPEIGIRNRVGNEYREVTRCTVQPSLNEKQLEPAFDATTRTATQYLHSPSIRNKMCGPVSYTHAVIQL